MNQKSPVRAAIVFARMDSRRLPGKSLIKLGGRTLLGHCINRLSSSDVFKTIVATSDRMIDDPIAQAALDSGALCFRGDATDLNVRVQGCLNEFAIDSFARVNGDSPLLSKDLIELGFELLDLNGYDFVTNLVPRHFPYGISVEVFKSAFFLESVSSSTRQDKENITSFFYDDLEKLNVGIIPYDAKTNDHSLRLTIDEKEDLVFFDKLLELDPLILEKPFERVMELIENDTGLIKNRTFR